MEDDGRIQTSGDIVTEVAVNQKRTRLTPYAALSAMFAAFSGLWQFGFSIGTINAAGAPLRKAITQSYEDRYGEELRPDVLNALWVVISAAFPAGGIIGATLVNLVVRRFGRLKGILFGHVLTIAMSVLLGISGPIKSPEAIILGRIGIGISTAAIGTGITVMYIAELSPLHLRGYFGTMVATGIITGVTMANILGLPNILGSDGLWPVFMAFTGLPSVFFVILSKLMPRSPRRLFIENNDEMGATKTLRKIRGVQDVGLELKEMEKEAQRAVSSKQMTVIQLICSSELRRQLMCAIALPTAYQLTGINSIAFNMNNIFRQAGIPPSSIPYWSVGVWLCYLTFQCSVAILIEKYGRRRLLIVGYGIIAVSHALLTLSIEARHITIVMSYISIAASLGFLMGFALGPVPATFGTVAECFDQTSRSAAVTMSSVIFWVWATAVVLATPYLLASIGGYLFLSEGIVAIVMSIWIYLYLPETKNRPFSEIQSAFRGKI